MVEEDIVDAETREGIQAGAQHRVIGAADIAAEVAVSAAACHGKFQHQQRHHEVGQPVLGEDEGQPVFSLILCARLTNASTLDSFLLCAAFALLSGIWNSGTE